MPGPPPGAILPVGSTGFAVVAVVDVLTAGDITATGEVAGVGKSAFERNQERLAGLGEAAAGDMAGAGVAAGEASFLERFCLATLGEGSALAAGDTAGAGVAGGEASFLERLCLATLGEDSGVGDGEGDWPSNATRENPVKAIIRPRDFFIPTTLGPPPLPGNAKTGAKHLIQHDELANSLVLCKAERQAANAMDELINMVVQKTGLSPEDARKAVEAVISALKTRLPAPIAAHLDSFLSGGASGGLAALEAEADDLVKGKLSGLFGGNA
jgi:hypothetical protein